MTDDTGSAVADMVLALPNGAELRWYSDEIDPSHPYGTGWVDVWVDDLMAWTIVARTQDPDEMQVEPDLLHLTMADPNRPGTPEVWSMAIPHVEPSQLPDEYAEALGKAAVKFPGCDHAIRPAWSIARINETIEAWCAGLGRRVKAVWDSDHGPSPMMAAALETLNALKDGTAESYVLMPGKEEGEDGYTVRVAGPTMDLIAHLMIDDPEAAEGMIQTLGEIKRLGPNL